MSKEDMRRKEKIIRDYLKDKLSKGAADRKEIIEDLFPLVGGADFDRLLTRVSNNMGVVKIRNRDLTTWWDWPGGWQTESPTEPS